MDLSVYYQNVRGLRTKLSSFLAASSISEHDVICITESWLHPSIHDGEILDSTYTIYRKDRNSLLSGYERGGGVFIAVKRYIEAEVIPLVDDGIEQIFVRVMGNNWDTIIGCVYLPPHTYETYVTHSSTISFITDKFRNAKLLVVGDFNLPSSSPSNNCTNLLYDCYSSSGCKQCNCILNAQNNTLDLCFSDIDISPNITPALVPEDKYHPALAVELDFKPSLTPDASPIYVFKKANYINLNAFFMRTNWVDLYKQETVDDKLDWLYHKIYEGVSQFVPVYSNKSRNFPSWFSKELVEKVKLKKAAHTLYKKRKTMLNYTRFSNLRLECKKLSTECYRSYIDRVENSLQSNTKAFWNFITIARYHRPWCGAIKQLILEPKLVIFSRHTFKAHTHQSPKTPLLICILPNRVLA
ncbi:uncharacterized protein LOC118736201 [Rhagoletis pomonella]|uniref:uncharacterized protein LOC118736201 n=1 Tax=Rhagoletis pomonella TaxID=28610 RepID=UPI00177E6B41|nr:uncharacterized protein LOC118736201 [Rhagoletis pomonella]